MKENKLTWIVLWLIAARIIPIGLVSYRFDLFKSTTSTGVRIGVIGLILIVWFIFALWDLFKEWVRTFPDGMFRELLQAVVKVGPYILLWFIGIIARNLTEDFAFITFTLMLSQLTAVYFRARYNMLHRKALKKRGYVDVIRH